MSQKKIAGIISASGVIMFVIMFGYYALFVADRHLQQKVNPPAAVVAEQPTQASVTETFDALSICEGVIKKDRSNASVVAGNKIVYARMQLEKGKIWVDPNLWNGLPATHRREGIEMAAVCYRPGERKVEKLTVYDVNSGTKLTTWTARREAQAPKWIEEVVPPGAYADGYKNAKWGMTRNQVDKALELPLVGESSFEYSMGPRKAISYDMGEDRRLTAHFLLNRLYSVKYDSDAGGYKSRSVKQAIIDALTAKYGKPVYEPSSSAKGNSRYKDAGELVWRDGETRIETDRASWDPCSSPKTFRCGTDNWDVEYSHQGLEAKLVKAHERMLSEKAAAYSARRDREREEERRKAEALAIADL